MAQLSRELFWSKPNWLLGQESDTHLSTGTSLVHASHCLILSQILNRIPDLDVSQLTPDLPRPFEHSFIFLVAYLFNLFVSVPVLSFSIFHHIFSWRTKSSLKLWLQSDKSLPGRVFETLCEELPP